MLVNVISTGEEIRNGDVVDINSPWAASLLSSLGFEIGYQLTCGDRIPDLVSVLQFARTNAQIVILGGGLGPTQDDCTLDAVAQHLELPLVIDPDQKAELKSRFQELNLPYTENQSRQARLPKGAIWLPNSCGTAPGVMIRMAEQRIFCLPGPPLEFQTMLKEQVLPKLLEQDFGFKPSKFFSNMTLRVFGKGEGWIAHALRDLQSQIQGLTIGYRALFPDIEVKLNIQAESRSAAEKTLQQAEEAVLQCLGDLVYAKGEQTLAETVVSRLKELNLTLAVAESCTGGWVSKLITDVSGSSEVYKGGVVSYANDLKHDVLGVDSSILEGPGAVSAPCAEAMADGMRRLTNADLAISVTGIAGPTGGTPQKPVGTVFFGICDRQTQKSHHRQFGFSDREKNRKVSAYAALALIRNHLKKASRKRD